MAGMWSNQSIIPTFDVSAKTAEPKMAFNFAHLLSAACGGAPRRLGRLRRPWARCARLFWEGYQHQKSAGEGTHSVLVANRRCLSASVGSLSSRSGVRGSCASGEADAQPSPTVAVRPSPRLSAGFISRAGCISPPVASTRATD